MATTSVSGRTLIDALNDKYNDTSDRDNSFCEIYVPAGAPGKSDGAFRVPENLALESYDITSAGDPSEFSDLCYKVRELDLINNKLYDWNQVFAILDGLPLLTFLNLSRNPLSEFDKLLTDKRYKNLTKLALNFTDISWQSVTNLLVVFPNLDELYLSGNSYTDITLNIPAYQSLRLLQLTSNNISDWLQTTKLDQLFPNLDNLVLAENPISNCGTAEDNSGIFGQLKVLNMNNTKICDWNELDKLAAMKQLKDLRLTGIPLVEGIESSQKREQLMSVHFPHLVRLNGGTVRQSDIDTSETVYLRHFEHQENKPNIYETLLKKHGPLQELAEVDMKPKFSVLLNIVCGDRKMQLDVPTKQSLGQLRRSLKQFVGSSKFHLFLDRAYGGYREDILGCYNNRLLHSMNLLDNDTFLCVRSDMPAEKEEHVEGTYRVAYM